MRFPAGALGFLVASILVASPLPAAGAATRNVVLVSIDTLRADHVGCYGAKGNPTPNLDKLAGRGVRFEKAWSAVPMTTPSHATLFTGLFPPTNGVRTNGREKIPADRKTLAEALRDRGFATAGFVAAFPLDRQFGFDRGFDLYDDRMPRFDRGPSRFSAEQRASVVVDRALEWYAGRDRAKPFFLFVHLFDPHGPYSPPEPFRSRFAKDPYSGEVAYADTELGRLLAKLEGDGRREDTLFVVLSDHGEGLGDHGELTHQLLVYDSTLRVPLVLAGPGLPAGRVVAESARLVDLFPTLAARLGASSPDGVAGVDLAPTWGPKRTPLPPGRIIWAESLEPEAQYGWAPLASVRQGRWKYIRAPREELYDVEADPGETKNLLGADPDVDGDMRRLMRRAEKELAPPEGSKPSEAKLDAEAMAKLQSLGYLAAGPGAASDDDPLKRPDPKDRIALVNAFELAHSLEGTAPEKALAKYEELLRANPGESWLRVVFAKALVRTGQGERILSLLSKRTVGAMPAARRAEAIELRAVAFEIEGRWSEALAEWDALAAAAGELGAETSRRGKVGTLGRMVRLGLEREALAPLETLAAAPSPDAEVLRQLGLAKVAVGRDAEGLAALTRSASLAPAETGGSPDLRARAEAADLLLSRGQRERAATVLAPIASDRAGRNPRLSSRLWDVADLLPGPDRDPIAAGRDRLAEGKPAAAVEALVVSGGSRSSTNPNRFEALATALVAAGRLEEASVAVETALRLDPDFPPGLVARGRLEEARGGGGAAEKSYRRALELDGAFVPAYSALGKLLSRQGKHREAIGLLRRAVSLRLEDPGPHVDLAAAFRAAGAVDQAEYEENEARRLSGGS